MRFVLLVLVNLMCAFGMAQYNSDHKEVRKKKIKTATANLTDLGKTFSWSYTYDNKGRMIVEMYSDSEYESKTYMERRYSPSGRLISEYRLSYHGWPKFIDGNYYHTYDTSSILLKKFDEKSGELIYELRRKYYTEGKGWLFEIRGDSTYYYQIENGIYRIHSIRLKQEVDTIKRGYAKIEYSFQNRNHKDPNSPIDTSVYSRVIVLDRKGEDIRDYHLLPNKIDSGIVRKADGTWYSQVSDSSCHLKLYYTYKNEYRLNGDLKRFTRFDHLKDTVTVHEFHPRSKEPGIQSLEEIKKHGTVIYEYYE